MVFSLFFLNILSARASSSFPIFFKLLNLLCHFHVPFFCTKISIPCAMSIFCPRAFSINPFPCCFVVHFSGCSIPYSSCCYSSNSRAISILSPRAYSRNPFPFVVFPFADCPYSPYSFNPFSAQEPQDRQSITSASGATSEVESCWVHSKTKPRHLLPLYSLRITIGLARP